MVDLKSDETKILKEKYKQAKKEIILPDKNQDFLEATLKLVDQ